MPHTQTQTEWEDEVAVQILQFIRGELYLDLRFLDVALCELTPKREDRIHSFATDGQYLCYAPEPLLRIFQSNPLFLTRAYLHTTLHCIFSHLWIRGMRRRELWDIACDIAVELIIDDLDKKSTRRALSYLRQQTYEELKTKERICSAAEIYRLISLYPTKKLQELAQEFYTDDHGLWPDEEQMKSPMQNNLAKKWDKIARQSKIDLEQHGEDKASGEEQMEKLLSASKSRRDYREFLRKFAVLREEMQVDPDEFDLSYYTYGLQTYGNMPLIEPLESREVFKIQEFVVVIDTSYSTSGAEGELVKRFLQETFDVLTQQNSFFSKCRIHIIQCDNKVQMDEVVENQQELEKLLMRFQLCGGGGTDFRPAFTYVNELIMNGELKNLKGLLYFTDGQGIYPKKRPDYETAFIYIENPEQPNPGKSNPGQPNPGNDTANRAAGSMIDADPSRQAPPWAIRMELSPEELMES